MSFTTDQLGAWEIHNFHAQLGSSCLPGEGIAELWATLVVAAACMAALLFRRTDALWVPVAFLCAFLAFGLHTFVQRTNDLPFEVREYYRKIEINPIGWGATGLGILLISLESLLWWRTEWRRRRRVSLRTFD
jgi:hypothetical protein